MRRLALLLLVLGLAVVSAPAATAANPGDPVNTRRPYISGKTFQWKMTATAFPGVWEPADTPLAYQWVRNGKDIPGATKSTYAMTKTEDLGAGMRVRVYPVGRPDLAVTSEQRPVSRIPMKALRRPAVVGTPRYGQTLTVDRGAWSGVGSLSYKYQWYSDGKRIPGRVYSRYTPTPDMVGTKLSVAVEAHRTGYLPGYLKSWSRTLSHREDIRKTVYYSIGTRGSINTSVATFAKHAQETLDDARGWRANGIKFVQVKSGGDFVLMLSEARYVPSFSSACSAYYSCRVGNYVIINQDRWKFATPVWRDRGHTIRGYQHMVVNHETGHWLGKAHDFCRGPGQQAPIMQQQSKGLQGCKANGWVTMREMYAPRFGF